MYAILTGSSHPVRFDYQQKAADFLLPNWLNSKTTDVLITSENAVIFGQNSEADLPTFTLALSAGVLTPSSSPPPHRVDVEEASETLLVLIIPKGTPRRGNSLNTSGQELDDPRRTARPLNTVFRLRG